MAELTARQPAPGGAPNGSAGGAAEALASAGGWLSPLARAQYDALARMRWQVFLSGLKAIRGITELGARGVQLFVFSLMGIGLGIGLSVASYQIASKSQWAFLPVVFWGVAFLWQTVPIGLASFQDQFDMSSLLRFPVSFGTFYVLYVVFGLLDVSTVLGGLCCTGILIGTGLARPELIGWLLAGLAAFAVCNVLLARAVLAWLDRWLSQRRTREIVSALFLVGLVGLQLLNPGLRQQRRRHTRTAAQVETDRRHAAEWRQGLVVVNRAQAWMPPGLLAGGTAEENERKPLTALGALAGMGLWVVAVGGVLGVRLRAEYRGENLGYAPRRRKAEKAEKAAREWGIGGNGPLTALIEKELRTLTRSMPQLYALAVPVVMVFVIGTIFRNTAGAGRHVFTLAVPVCVAYGLLGFTRVIYNNLGMEGAGIQMLFLSPTPIRTVLLGKNLFHAALYLLMGAASGALAVWRVGWPSLAVTLATAAWVVLAVPVNLTVGNVLSLVMPYKVNPGRLTRQPGSQANALLGMGCQATLLGIGGAVFGLCFFFGRQWLAAPLLLVLAAVATVVYLRFLRNSDTMANAHREDLLEVLGKVG
ncbi:MAG TPA: hypothetical protein VFU55_04915 [Terracidiphilus sp.]|nr:hypothetical protein [Terracidiphilus sp.]